MHICVVRGVRVADNHSEVIYAVSLTVAAPEITDVRQFSVCKNKRIRVARLQSGKPSRNSEIIDSVRLSERTAQSSKIFDLLRMRIPDHGMRDRVPELV